MEKWLFVPRVLRRIADPVFFAGSVACFLRGAAAVLALYAAVGFILAWKKIFALPGEAVVGGVFFQLALVAATYAALHAILLRAGDAGRTAPRDFPALTLGALLLRLTGEVAAFAALFLGVGGGIFIWFAGRKADGVLQSLPKVLSFLRAGEGNFAAGALVIVKGVVFGGLALLTAYVLAELIVLATGARRTPAAGE